MSGRRINDYGDYPSNSDEMMASRNKLKRFDSAEGAGHIGIEYPDTTEDIKKDQEDGVKQLKKHRIKPGYRN